MLQEEEGNKTQMEAVTPHLLFLQITLRYMDGEPARRVTLEDFSNIATPQFFTSIARPEVQVANISYPHSLIQLI